MDQTSPSSASHIGRFLYAMAVIGAVFLPVAAYAAPSDNGSLLGTDPAAMMSTTKSFYTGSTATAEAAPSDQGSQTHVGTDYAATMSAAKAG
jgi:hypothetical protein